MNLKEISKEIYIKKWILIISVTVFVIFGVIYSYNFTTPKYKSDSSVIILDEKKRELDNTYSNLINSRNLVEEVKEKLEIQISTEELCANISIKRLKNTDILKITVKNENAKQAQKLATEVVKVFLSDIEEIYNITDTYIIENANLSQVPYNINIYRDITIFVIIGAIVGMIIIFGFEKILNKVKNIITKIKELGKICKEFSKKIITKIERIKNKNIEENVEHSHLENIDITNSKTKKKEKNEIKKIEKKKLKEEKNIIKAEKQAQKEEEKSSKKQIKSEEKARNQEAKNIKREANKIKINENKEKIKLKLKNCKIKAQEKISSLKENFKIQKEKFLNNKEIWISKYQEYKVKQTEKKVEKENLKKEKNIIKAEKQMKQAEEKAIREAESLKRKEEEKIKREAEKVRQAEEKAIKDAEIAEGKAKKEAEAIKIKEETKERKAKEKEAAKYTDEYLEENLYPKTKYNKF